MNDLLNKIKHGENRKLEFKATLPKGNQIAKTAVAFANGTGGDIVVGVDDNANITGLTDEQLRIYPDMLSGMIYDTVTPSLLPEIFTTNIDGKIVIVVRVYPGSDIKFAIFDDRIEITSPGSLPQSLDIKDLGSGRSEVRNKVIANFFKKVHLIEQWGTGTVKIINLCKSYDLQVPMFIETGLHFKTIFKRSIVSTQETAQETVHGIEGTKAEILSLLEKKPSLTKDNLMVALNKGDGTIKQHLSELKKMGLIKRVGSTKAGHWRVLK